MQKILFYIALFLWTGLKAQQLKPEVVMTTGHSDQVSVMTVSNNGKFLASADNNKILKIWDISKAMEFRTLSGTNGRCEQLAFSPNNVDLACITSDGELLVYNVISGEIWFKDRASYSTKGLYFSDSTTVFFTNESGNVSKLNIKDNSVVSTTEVYCTSLVVDNKSQKAYCLDHLGNLIIVNTENMSVIKSIKLFSEFNFPFCRATITADGSLIAYGFNDDKLRFFDTGEEKFVYTSPKLDSKIIDLEFDKKDNHLYLATHGGNVQIIDYLSKKIVTFFTEQYLASQCLTGHPDGNILFLGNFDAIRLYNKETKSIFKEFSSKISGIINMAYSQDGNYVAIATDKLKIQLWDLKLNKIVSEVQGFFPCEFVDSGKAIIAMNNTLNLGVWDVASGSLIRELPTESELIQCLAISPDGKNIAGAGFNNEIKIWDFETGKKSMLLKGHTAGIITLDFSPDGKFLASGGYDQTSRVWDLESKKQIQEFKEQELVINAVKFSPDGKSLATSCWDKTIYLRNTENWQTNKILKGHVNMITSIDFNKDGNVLVSGAGNNSVWEADNSIIFWDVNSGEILCRHKEHNSAITKVVFDKEADRVFSTSAEGVLKISDYKSCETIVTYLAIGGEDFMIYTPDNYYMASRNALKGIAFRLGDKLISFDQFDIYLNRPDIVATRIGKSPENLIKAYNYLYQKRLRKLNIDEGSLNLDYQIPNIKLETKPDIVTTENTTNIWVLAWDDNHLIKQINVYVNDVPIYGESGYQSSIMVKSVRKEFNIPLINGLNKVQISCINENGAESVYESFEIIKENDLSKPDLYLVSIGVGKYEDSRFNLTYPSKDATDVVAKLKETSGIYNQMFIKTLLDEEVVLTNFDQLITFFENCKPQDVAIIFLAGHGVLDENFDYYYATYNMDFDDPGKFGISYDKIHALLDKLKSLKKLLIMDTCHSGELDKSEIERIPEADIEEGNVEFRAVAAGVRNKEAFGFENSLELVQDIFSYSQKGSGATVISSAGGAEFAMESDIWKNGLFTYAFLSGLTDFRADVNKDGKITVSEIRSFVNSTVKELSDGKQIPSSREDNISLDYVIFGK